MIEKKTYIGLVSGLYEYFFIDVCYCTDVNVRCAR
jgi:hypothetical protein